MRLLITVKIITLYIYTYIYIYIYIYIYTYIYFAISRYATEVTNVYDIRCFYDKTAARISIVPMHATCPVRLTFLHIVATTIYGGDAARTLTF
jgi:hypothetical protein